jgi:phosphoglycolate phosphatase
MQINNNHYKHVIWDWNGTLLNDSWLCVEVMSGVLERRNMMKCTHDIYQNIFDFPVENYYKTLGFDFEKESFEIVGTEFIVEYEKRKFECGLYPSTIKILKTIDEAGISQSLLSAYKQQTLDELVDHFGLRGFFLKVVGLNDHYAKSKLDNGKLLIEGLGIDPKQIVLVGDTKHARYQFSKSLKMCSVSFWKKALK